MKSLLFMLLLFTLNTPLFTLPSAQADMAMVPQTGQTTSYVVGDDGDVQEGVPWPIPRFTDNSNGTMTDNLTGLVWLKNANCFDMVGGINKTSGSLVWSEAIKWSNALASGKCGLTDDSTAGQWRLPNLKELKILVNLQQVTSATWLNGLGFANVKPYGYWSSSTDADYTSYAWDVILSDGRVFINDKADYSYVWPVRSGQTAAFVQLAATGQTVSYAPADDGALTKGLAWPSSRFTDLNDGTNLDNLTGLIWLKNVNCTETVGGVPNSTGYLPWANAVAWSNAMTSGHCGLTDGSTTGDWRLPNVAQLESLVDLSRYRPALPVGHLFSAVQTGNYWSSSTLAIDSGYAYGVYMDLGYMDIPGKNNGGYAWPVRSGQFWALDSLIIGASAPLLSFGERPVGTAPVTKQITLSNKGIANISVTSMAVNGVDFSVTPGGDKPCSTMTPTLAAGASCTVLASFAPLNGGAKNAKNANLTVKANGKSVALPLNGTGTISKTLTITSANPFSGEAITVSPTDLNGATNGATEFTRSYKQGTNVTLTAPGTSGVNYFYDWTGCDSVSGVACTVSMITDKTVMASYNTRPPAPIGITPIPGNSQVGISWSAVPGATLYNLYYATTPGVTKATGIKIANVTSPKTLSSLINGTPYYFVVTSMNLNGESAESAQVSAIPTVPSVGAYTPADLMGVWEGNSLEAPGPWWVRRTFTIGTEGSFSAPGTSSTGPKSTLTGTLNITAEGIITWPGYPTDFRCAMDSGKSVFACTLSVPDGVENAVFTKKAASYSPADLVGNWEWNLLGTEGAHWLRATSTVSLDGSFSADYNSDNTAFGTWTGTLSITSGGSVSMSIPPVSTPDSCSMDSGKTVIVCTNTDTGHGETLMWILTKKAASYSPSDLTGTWNLNGLASGGGAFRWIRGNMNFNANGSYTDTLNMSSGSSYPASGTFGITAAGVITPDYSANNQCSMNANKTFMACTSDWTAAHTTSELTVFTKQLQVSKTLTGLAITSGPASLFENSSATYIATAYWSDGTSTAITPAWSVSPATYATIDSTGKLTALTVPANQTISVKGTFTYGGITLTATTPVTIVNTSSTLTMTLAGTGGGSVNGVRGTDSVVACTYPPQSGLCSSALPSGSAVNLSSAPRADSIAVWGTQCGTCTGLSCVLNLDSDKNCTATFTLVPKAKIGATGYSSFHDAYVASSATGMTTILLLADVLPISDTISKQLSLKGGYDTGFTSQTGFTTLQDAFTIGTGSAVVDRVVIK